MSNVTNNQKLKEELEQTGALKFDASDVPLSETQWQMLETLAKDSEYKHVIGGDAGEGHSIYVSRYVNDVIEPTDLQPVANAVREIVMSDEMVSFYQQFIGDKPLCLRRCQANLLKSKDFIGRHIDQHSNADYIASVVFHLDSNYKGGNFVSLPQTESELKIHPKPHSVVVNRGDVWHEVEPVISGERRTLACFLSGEFGKSRHGRQAFEVSI